MVHTGHITPAVVGAWARAVTSTSLGLVLAIATFVVGGVLEPQIGGFWQMLVAVTSVAALVSIPWIVWVNAKAVR